MKNIIITILSLVIVLSINPQDYVWIDYSITNPITLTQNNKYKTNIPCRVRIGTKCSYNYKLLPLDWISLDDGSLVLPERDATKDGNFLIQAELSDMSGQKLNANIVLEITNKSLKVIDQSDYYKKMGFTPQDKTNPSSTYQVSPMEKDIPDGFPSLTDIETMINSGEARRIKQTIQQITLNYAPCRSKINYLTLVKQLIKKLITKNQNKISQNTNQIQKLNTKLISFKIKKMDQLEKSGITKDIENLIKKISKVNQQYANNKAVASYYQGLANQTLERFKKATGKVKEIDIQKNKKELKKLQNRQLTWNKWLIKAIKNRLVLQKGLYKINLLKQSKGMQNNLINSYIIPAYQTNMNQLLQAESNRLQNQIKLIDLNQEFQQNMQLIKYIDLHLAQLHPDGFISNLNTNSNQNVQTVDKIKNQNIGIAQQIQNIKLIIKQLKQCNQIL